MSPVRKQFLGSVVALLLMLSCITPAGATPVHQPDTLSKRDRVLLTEARAREVAQQRRGFGGDEVQRRSAARHLRASQQFQVELRLHGS